MKQPPYSRTRRDDDDDDEDDRKPPARTNMPLSSSPPSHPQSHGSNHNDIEDDDDDEYEEEEEEHYSESGVFSHTSSTAVASVDHSTFHDTHAASSTMAVNRRNNTNHSSNHSNNNNNTNNSNSQQQYWWNQVFLSPFRSSSSSSSSITKPTMHNDDHYTKYKNVDDDDDDDYIYQTPTNASMIHAIRNEINISNYRNTTGNTSGTGLPNLTFATPYTPESQLNREEEAHHTAAHQTTPSTFNTVPSVSKVFTTTTLTNTKTKPTTFTTTTPTTPHSYTINRSSTPTSPVEQITNTTITTLQRSTILYLGSTTMAWIILLSHILPSVVLYTLVWIIISTVLMIQAFYTTIQEYYYHMVVMGPGLGSMLLPQSVYNLLTQESLHEFLTDEVMVLEYRHLLLYFLPISATQLRDLLRRIAPQHQQRLQRRGEIGTLLFGESIMRIILGHTQYEQWRSRRILSQPPSSSSSSNISTDGNNGINNPQIATQPQGSTTLLLHDSFDDDHSDLGLDISGDDMIGGNHALAQRLGLTATARTMSSSPMPPSIVIDNSTTTNNSNSNTNRTPLPNEVITTNSSNRLNATSSNIATNRTVAAAERATTYDNQEYQVLMDALWDSFYGAIWNPITDYVRTTYLVPTLHRISHVTLHTGIVLLSISTGNVFGLWGWSYQIMYNQLRMYLPTSRGILSTTTITTNAQQSRDTTPDNSTPISNQPTSLYRSFGLFSRPSTTTWSTALLGSASLGISYYSRRYVRRYYDMTAMLDANRNNNDAATNPNAGTSNDERKSNKKE